MAELDEDDRTCSICFEEFLVPKILNCRHTFCQPCLKSYLKKSDETEKITCPLCRQKQSLVGKNLDQLLDNYFVTQKPPEPNEKLCCFICFEETELKSCSHCDLKLCPNCKASHRLALKLSDDKYQVSSDSESDVTTADFDDADVTDDAIIPFHLNLSGQFIKTKFNVILLSSFQVLSLVSPPQDDQNNFVSTIHAADNGLCDIITHLGPESILVDSSGEELQREFFDKGISDITDIGIGKKVISNFNLSLLLEVEKGKGVQLFSQTGKVQPTALCQLDDGQIVCVGPHRKSDHMTESKEKCNTGAMQFYDKYGQLSKEITGSATDGYFSYPLGMSLNKRNHTICVTDRDRRCVYIFREDGTLTHRYTGGSESSRGLLLFDPCVFAPHPICHDNACNIIVGNQADGSVHVLDPVGQFLGYIVTRDKLGLGMVSALCFDSEGRLWIGDQKDGMIRVLEITSYNNNVQPNESASRGCLLPSINDYLFQ